MKKNNLKIVKIDKNKKLFNYEKKILIKDLTLDLQLGYYDFEKEKKQKVKFNLEVSCLLQIEKLEILKQCTSVGIQISKKRSHEKL